MDTTRKVLAAKQKENFQKCRALREEQLKALGYEYPSEEQQKENLAYNLIRLEMDKA